MSYYQFLYEFSLVYLLLLNLHIFHYSIFFLIYIYFFFFFDIERLIYYSSLRWSGEPYRNRTINVVHVPMKGFCYLT